MANSFSSVLAYRSNLCKIIFSRFNTQYCGCVLFMWQAYLLVNLKDLLQYPTDQLDLDTLEPVAPGEIVDIVVEEDEEDDPLE